MQSLLHCAALAEVSCRVDSLAGRCRDTPAGPSSFSSCNFSSVSSLLPPTYMRGSASALRHRVIWLNRRCSGEGGPSVKLVSFSKKITGQYFSSSEKRPNRRGEGEGPRGVCQKGNFSGIFFLAPFPYSMSLPNWRPWSLPAPIGYNSL